MFGLDKGKSLEREVFDIITGLINKNQFIVGFPNVYVYQQKEYYSKDREDYIKVDISVEKYLGDKELVPPSLIIVLECKDYKGYISVDEIEEFHAKLQQIGANNTKGIIVTSSGAFQKSTIKYAKSKGIGLARIMPDNQVEFVMHSPRHPEERFLNRVIKKIKENLFIIGALVEINYISQNESHYIFDQNIKRLKIYWQNKKTIAIKGFSCLDEYIQMLISN